MPYFCASARRPAVLRRIPHRPAPGHLRAVEVIPCRPRRPLTLFDDPAGRGQSELDSLADPVAQGLLLEVTFIVPELTMAPTVPAMADLVPLVEASRAEALAAAESHAKELVMCLAA